MEQLLHFGTGGRDAGGGTVADRFAPAAPASEHRASQRDVLRVGNVARSAETDLGERIEAVAGVLFDGRKLETQVALLCAKARRFGPVFTLYVVDNSGFAPSEKCRDNEAHTLTGASGSEGEDVLGAVMA